MNSESDQCKCLAVRTGERRRAHFKSNVSELDVSCAGVQALHASLCVDRAVIHDICAGPLAAHVTEAMTAVHAIVSTPKVRPVPSVAAPTSRRFPCWASRVVEWRAPALVAVALILVVVEYRAAHPTPPRVARIAFGFSAFVGVAFGLNLARRASTLDPIEALRSV